MSFDPNADYSITLTEASAMTKRFRDNSPSTAIIALVIGASKIQQILDQTGCEGLRAYYALDDSNNPQLVYVGVDADGNDLVNGVLGDRNFPCPASCSSANALNS
jgi:hypothetical protein